MDVVRVVRIVLLMVSPTLIIGAAIYVPRVVRSRLTRRKDREWAAEPRHAPIEQLAADLRRLLVRYDAVRQSPQVTMRAHHLWALEAAITDQACAAAAALGVACPARPPDGRLPSAHLHALVRGLAEAGLVMPPSVSWLAADG